MNARDTITNNPALSLLATAVATSLMGGVGFEQLGGGADAKEGIAQIVQMAERQIVAANAERDRMIEARDEVKVLYLECNAARLGDPQ